MMDEPQEDDTEKSEANGDEISEPIEEDGS